MLSTKNGNLFHEPLESAKVFCPKPNSNHNLPYTRCRTLVSFLFVGNESGASVVGG